MSDDPTYIVKLVRNLESMPLQDAIFSALEDEWDEDSIRYTIESFVEAELEEV